MAIGEPKCGVCGSDIVSGMFHSCKPAWNEENAKLRAEHGGSGGPCCLTFEQLKHSTDKTQALELQKDEYRKALQEIVTIGEISQEEPTSGYSDTMRVRDCASVAKDALGVEKPKSVRPIEEELAELAAKVPPEEWAKVKPKIEELLGRSEKRKEGP